LNLVLNYFHVTHLSLSSFIAAIFKKKPQISLSFSFLTKSYKTQTFKIENKIEKKQKKKTEKMHFKKLCQDKKKMAIKKSSLKTKIKIKSMQSIFTQVLKQHTNSL